MFLGYSHVKKAVGIVPGKGVQPGSLCHGGSNSHNPGILPGKGHDCSAEGLGKTEGIEFFHFAVRDGKGTDTVEAGRVVFPAGSTMTGQRQTPGEAFAWQTARYDTKLQ